jgi:hypothetical protein
MEPRQEHTTPPPEGDPAIEAAIALAATMGWDQSQNNRGRPCREMEGEDPLDIL